MIDTTTTYETLEQRIKRVFQIDTKFNLLYISPIQRTEIIINCFWDWQAFQQLIISKLKTKFLFFTIKFS